MGESWVSSVVIRGGRHVACFSPQSSMGVRWFTIYNGVIRYAKLVLYVCWSSSGYAQLRSGCKHRRPSTSNPIVDDCNLILSKTLSPLAVIERCEFLVYLLTRLYGSFHYPLLTSRRHLRPLFFERWGRGHYRAAAYQHQR